MDLMLLRIFQREVDRQCRFALMAYSELLAALQRLDAEEQTAAANMRARAHSRRSSTEPIGANSYADVRAHVERLIAESRIEVEREMARRQLSADRVWYSLQNYLVALGNVSKLLWPQKSKKPSTVPNRASDLRGSLDVLDESPLRPRDHRNHFEHFDDRLEEWWSKSPRHNFMDDTIGPVGIVQGLDTIDGHRQLDPSTMTLVFRGEELNLAHLAAEVEALRARASKEATKPHWDTEVLRGG